MPNGTVESIYIAGAAESKPQSVGQVAAIPGGSDAGRGAESPDG
jgi:hypothetical protein